MHLDILIVADQCEANEAFLRILETKGHNVSGTFTSERARQFLKTSDLRIPDLILAFATLNFQSILDFVKMVWDWRVSRNFAPCPMILTIAVNERLSEYQKIFERAGSRLILTRDPQTLLHEITGAQQTIAEQRLGKLHCIQIHEHKSGLMLCSPGEHCTSLAIAGFEPGVGELPVASRIRTFIAALMTLNGQFLNRREIEGRLRKHTLYKSSPFDVPSLATIKTYLDQDCPEAFERTVQNLRLGYEPRKLIEKQFREGNEVAYRLKFSWEIRHVQPSVCLRSH